MEVKTKSPNGQAIVAQLDQLFRASVKHLRDDIEAYIAEGTLPDPAARTTGRYAYPEIHLTWSGDTDSAEPQRSFGRLPAPGHYVTSVTKPSLFGDYLAEQIDILIADYGVVVEAREGRQEIPFPYVLDAGTEFGDVRAIDLARWFPSTELAAIGDEIADGLLTADPSLPHPLSLFDGLRTDFSLARLRHYTGTPPEHVQRYVLFTNYHRYVDEFVRWACSQLGNGSGYTMLSCPGGVTVTDQTEDPLSSVADSAWRRHQMPAWHLCAPDKSGITLVSIGVGPSNAKTITDHLAVLRPEAWLMIGHCGGLRASQRIGDFVLAHAYLRDDHVLDDLLPPEIPIPPIAEVQLAMAKAAEIVSGDQDGGTGELRAVKQVVRVLAQRFKCAAAQTIAGDRLQPVGRNDHVGIDVLCAERDRPAIDFAQGFHQSVSGASSGWGGVAVGFLACSRRREA